MKEFLVTAQGYSKEDSYKQTMLLHDSFFASNTDEAESMFNKKFENSDKMK